MSENDNSTANPVTGLSVQDLVTTIKLIQVSTERGVWKAEELSTVGGLYERVLAFLESTGAVSISRDPVVGNEESTSEETTENISQVEEEN